MSFVQWLFTMFVPRSWAESMEAESRQWMIQCPCGFERSVWDAGGIRWKAAGEKICWGYCEQCGQNTRQRIYKSETTSPQKSETV